MIKDKTPEEIKDGLNHCQLEGSGCQGCPYQEDPHCLELITGDAADLIHSLEDKIEQINIALTAEREKLDRLWPISPKEVANA